MKIYTEVTSANDFEFWSGAKDVASYLADEEIETIFSMLEECYPDGMTDTQLNDFFWFEPDTIAEWLDYGDFDYMVAVKDNNCTEDCANCTIFDCEYCRNDED